MSIAAAISEMKPVSLEQMDRVKLMDRTDRKFWFNARHLEGLLRSIEQDYYILEIEGERSMPYSTIYYDTADSEMYINHHRGKLNRFKIRRRSYESSHDSFLEVKFKSNKGRTIKERITTDYAPHSLNEVEREFLAQKSPYSGAELQESLDVRFRRLMLVGREANERCTIDQQLTFRSGEVSVVLDQLVIVEVKSEGRARSRIIEAMNERRLKPSGFSKYCIGRSVTDSDLKKNLFKLKHRAIEKQIEMPITQLIQTIK